MLQMCRIIFGIAYFILAIEREEVAAQHITDALQQYRVDAFSSEDVIHVGAVTVEALGKPGHTASLTAQLCFNFFPDVY